MTLKLDEFLSHYKTADEKVSALTHVACELNDDLLHAYEHTSERVTESIRQDALAVEAKIREIGRRR